MRDEILHKLTERVKELTALHKTARILQDETKSPTEIMSEIVMLLPPAWQFPEITSARICFMNLEAVTPNLDERARKQIADFTLHNGQKGSIEVFYSEERPHEYEGPFLKEERDLIESLAEMLRSYFQHRLSDEALQTAHDDLEKQVRERTEELVKANDALQAQITEYRNAEKRIKTYQEQLRQLAAELSLTEARERRAIATDLHDHIGQALAFIKMSISQFRGNAIFCGFESDIDNITNLLNQTIQYTRDLTFEISPPILYELGFEAALEWLAERYERKHHKKIKIEKKEPIGILADDVRVTLYKSVQELLTNVVKHSNATRITISMDVVDDVVHVKIADNGCGFDTGILDIASPNNERFGLFNIKVRLNHLGGMAIIKSSPGHGAVITLSAPRASKGK
jgi:signal transduction histidine kinase